VDVADADVTYLDDILYQTMAPVYFHLLSYEFCLTKSDMPIAYAALTRSIAGESSQSNVVISW